MRGYYPLPEGNKEVKNGKQLELLGLKNSAPVIKSRVQKAFDLIEQVSKRAGSRVQNRISEIEIHSHGYAEPGYKNPASGVVATGNWNSISTWDNKGQKILAEDHTVNELGTMLEEMGIKLEWSDEWTECCECGKLCRTTGDSYGWKRCYWADENSDGAVCVHCIKANKIMAKSYLESFEGECNKAVMLDLDPAKYGYKKVNGDFENGWHDGQDDNPKAIGAALRKLGIEKFIFNISSVGQFDIAFEVYVHKSQIKKFNDAKFHAENLKQFPSPAENMKKALQSVPVAAGPGIVVSQCHGDGAATSRVITPQDFVEGKAFK